jgi:hypothetical protein
VGWGWWGWRETECGTGSRERKRKRKRKAEEEEEEEEEESRGRGRGRRHGSKGRTSSCALSPCCNKEPASLLVVPLFLVGFSFLSGWFLY